MELISVIIPVYNIAEYLSRCLDSVIRQTYRNLEIILVDDGSTDHSGDICDEYAKRDSRIKVFHKENGGVSSARNLGIKRAHGEYIGFVDGDDVIEQEMFQRLIQNAVEYDCDISCCQMDTVGVDGIITSNYEVSSGRLNVENVVSEYFTPGFIKEMMYSQCNKIFVKSCLTGVQFKPYKYGEDILFIFEALMHANSVYYDNYIGYHYIHRKNSAMTSKFSPNRIDYIQAIRELERICADCYPQAAQKAHMWVYQHVLITLRQIIAGNQQKELAGFVKEEKCYLRDHVKYVRKLPFKRKLDYISVMYCPLYVKVLMSIKGR